MALSRCPRCGDVFLREKFDICNKCRSSENEKIDLIKRYIDEHPDANLEELTKVSGMDQDEILHYVREGRLLSEDLTSLEITCEECGTRISTGRFCRKCRERLSNAFSASLAELKIRRKN